MLKVENGKIVDSKGKKVRLRGIALGGWLMMEGYMLGGMNVPEHVFKANLAKIYGKAFVERFSRKFRSSFISPHDFVKIKKLGFNCVRLPLNYRLLEEPDGLQYLKNVVRDLAKNKLYVILDMHAVPGSQNKDWHSDSAGKALFWRSKKHRAKYIALWKKLAITFKNEKWIAGYDIMNEAVTKKVKLLQKIYQQAVDTIRSAGDRHIIFLEGNNYATDIDFLSGIKGENLAISIHFYQPFQFTFNLLPDARYPGKVAGREWNKIEIRKIFRKYSDLAKKLGMPVFVGEFGIASRSIDRGELSWVEDALQGFEEFDFHWTYWTYKSVKGMDFPDGLFQLSFKTGIIENPTKVSGMKNFKLNKNLYNILRKFVL
ncbi:MAG: cellulase family glycosylhydrolase [Candidatus Saganbacteria bacterium]|nr:cellulase family glycosylhydrolase [Candidatus Saganbacteria bacterium]